MVAWCGFSPLANAQDTPSISVPKNGTAVLQVEPMPWQVRRQEVLKLVDTINASQGKDQAALAKFESVLNGFERDTVSITPMEAMDLLHVFYVPQDQGLHLDTSLTMVASMATLGWYDALRFGDESGRAEIVNNERFFMRPFSGGGEEGVKQMADFLHNHPKAAADAVQMGVQLARKLRGRVHYDETWPAAYGLLRMQCALEGRKPCPKPTTLPKEKWDAAFEQAVARVEHYYRDNGKQ